MVEFSIIPTEILQRPKKKNIIFKKIITPRSVSTSISTPAETLTLTSAIKITIKTLKSVRQKLINEIKAKTDFYEVILRILNQLFSIINREFLTNSIDL